MIKQMPKFMVRTYQMICQKRGMLPLLIHRDGYKMVYFKYDKNTPAEISLEIDFFNLYPSLRSFQN
jgi:hypothetical protein